MKVAELMRTDVRSVEPDATVVDVITTLADGHVSGLPVVDRRARLLGVISASDVVMALAEAGSRDERERVFATRVRDIMTTRPHVVPADTDVQEAARVMLYLEIHRLFVEEDGQLVGVISQTDIVAAVAAARI